MKEKNSIIIVGIAKRNDKLLGYVNVPGDRNGIDERYINDERYVLNEPLNPYWGIKIPGVAFRSRNIIIDDFKDMDMAIAAIAVELFRAVIYLTATYRDNISGGKIKIKELYDIYNRLKEDEDRIVIDISKLIE